MDFHHLQALWLLTLLPPFLYKLAKARKRRSKDWASLGKSNAPPSSRAWPWVPIFILLIAAAAGPRWGRTGSYDLPPGHDVILLVDISRSMAAEDAVPNRLEAAVKAAGELVNELSQTEGDRVGVVAFAGKASLKCPLTENPLAVKDALAALRTGELKPGGTDLGAGLIAAADAFDDHEAVDGRTIVVFSDGEDHDNSWSAASELLRSRKIPVHVVAVGDPEKGHTIPIVGSGELHFHGEMVISRRNDQALKTVQEATGGFFVPMGIKRVDLAQLYRERILPTAKRRRDAERPPERIERYPAFVVAALGGMVAILWPFSRRTGLLGLLLIAGIGAAPTYRSASQAVSNGDVHYTQGKFELALAEFQMAIELDPKSSIARYNAGAALYQLKRFDEAEDHYRDARNLADSTLRMKIDYALGNTSVALGRYKESLNYYDACLSSKAAGVSLAKIRQDAAANRSFAVRLLPPPTTPDPDGDRKSPSQPRDNSGKDEPKIDPQNPGNGGGNSKSGNGNPRGGAPETKDADSPENRLNQMLDDVRKAGNSAVEGSPPPEKTTGDRKDW